MNEIAKENETQNIRNQSNNNLPKWFFAEWVSTLATFLVCFVFLFYQNQSQSARTDKLYEMFCDIQKQMKDEIISLKKDQYDFMKHLQNKPNINWPSSLRLKEKK